jgi:hypothetical protein
MNDKQLNIFDVIAQETDPPVARAHDPVTSYRAETWLNESGRRESYAKKILVELIRHPGQTAGELSDRPSLGLHYGQVWKRLSDLEHKGLARPEGLRVWVGSDREQRVWWPL